MGKKIIIAVVCVVVVFGIVFGISFLTKDVAENSTTVQSAETVAEEEFDGYMDEDMGDPEYIIDESEESTESADDFVPSDENLSDNTQDIVTTKFSISKIVDHTTGEEVQPRVVFGSGYKQDANYIRFDSDANFEMYLSGYFNNTKKGKYEEHGNVIFVEFDDESASEYDVKYGDDGLINYIIVNYGDYDIYFA